MTVIIRRTNPDELYHHGVKGMKWGVRKKRNTTVEKSPSKSSSKKPTSDEQKAAKTKKAIKIGAAVVGSALATYGAVKFVKWTNSQNIKLAAHAGADFANRFSEQLRPKAMMGFGPMASTRYTVGTNAAYDAGGKINSLVSEKLYSPKFSTRVKNAFEAKQIQRGKKTVFEIFDYDKTVGEILKETDTLNKGQSMFSKLVRDSIDLGGSLPKEILNYAR